MSKFLLSLGIIFFSISQLYANSLDSVKVEKVKVELSGFFRFDYWYDSRQIVDAVDGLFLLYPKKQDFDNNGADINAAGNINSLAMGTRIRSNMKMPDLFKAKSNVFVEVDFTGISSIVNVRLRHAYTKFEWEKSTLLVGLTWHPMFVTNVFPNVVSLNTGAPFQSFNRSPQVTYQYKLTNALTFSLSAINQSDSKSMGPIPSPNEASSSYLRNGLVPNMNTHLQYSKGSLTVGASLDFKSLRPRLYTTSLITANERYVTKERINSFSEMVYFKYQSEKLVIKAKGMYGQNLTEHLLLGGYAVSSLDSLTGKETYTPTNHIYTFGNITYGSKYQTSIFVGYARNLGADKNFVSSNLVYGRGLDIAYLYRISPSIAYIDSKFQISAEFEYTATSYGQIDIANKGKVKNGNTVANTRFLVVMQYSF